MDADLFSYFYIKVARVSEMWLVLYVEFNLSFFLRLR